MSLLLLFQSSGTAYTLPADTGVFTLSGKSVTMLSTRRFEPTAGSFTFTGRDVTLAKGFKLQAAATSFVFTGMSVNLVKSRLFTVATGVFVFSGASVTLREDHVLYAGCGQFYLTMRDVEFLHRTLPKKLFTSAITTPLTRLMNLFE